jgi:hypothetical protein
VGGSAINGDEENEYGLMAAYSSLDVSNTMYVQRADVDLAGLTGTTIRPLANPENGALWLDVATTNFGIFEWNYSTNEFTQRIPLVITSSTNLATDAVTPNVDLGSIGDYAVNAVGYNNTVFYKNYNNAWQLVGNTGWQLSVPAVTGTVSSPVIANTSIITINGSNVTLTSGSNVSSVVATINSAFGNAVIGGNIRARAINSQLSIAASDDAVGGNVNIANASGTALSTLGITAGVYTPTFDEVMKYSKTLQDFLDKYPNIKTHVNQLYGNIRSCFSDKVSILTDNGYKTIKEIGSEDRVAYYGNDNSIHYNGKYEIHFQGKKEVFEVELEDGTTLELTEDHRVLTQFGYKQVKDLEESDVLFSVE